MNKTLANIFCTFIKNKEKRDTVRNLLISSCKTFSTHYDIKGKNNTIILIRNGIEHLIKPNEIIKGLNIKINGNNNTIKLELPIIATNSLIEIGNDNVNIEIGSTKRFFNTQIRCCYGNNQILKIGKKVTISEMKIMLDEESGCIIGEDCKFSNSIRIWATDGHSILDKDTNEILNKPKGPIIIGNHCWIGEGVRITKNARIYDNSIIGGGSVAYKDYKETNVIIAGNPGQIVKRNITWDRKNCYDLTKSKKIGEK